MIVVSNAGPLIALGKIGQLGLLLRLYDQKRKANWVLIDNTHALRAAHQARLLPKGTLGVLLAAFHLAPA